MFLYSMPRQELLMLINKTFNYQETMVKYFVQFCIVFYGNKVCVVRLQD